MDINPEVTAELPENVRAFFAAIVRQTPTTGPFVYHMEREMGWTKWCLSVEGATTRYTVAIMTSSDNWK